MVGLVKYTNTDFTYLQYPKKALSITANLAFLIIPLMKNWE